MKSIVSKLLTRSQRNALVAGETVTFARKRRVATRTFTGLGLAAVGAMVLRAQDAAAQAASGIGAQVQAMATEASTAGGNVGSMVMYLAALICLVGGAWALWQSRQPQNRESGNLAKGLAGIVLCGLFATGGVWIGKAAQTASGGSATISGTNAPVTFGGAN